MIYIYKFTIGNSEIKGELAYYELLTDLGYPDLQTALLHIEDKALALSCVRWDGDEYDSYVFLDFGDITPQGRTISLRAGRAYDVMLPF